MASQIMEEAWRPLKEAIKTGNKTAYPLFKKVDHLTVREYLRDKMFVSTLHHSIGC